MIIKVVGEISNYCHDIVESNKIRRMLICQNIINLNKIDSIFNDLKIMLDNNSGGIYIIISQQLFFEDVEGIDTLLQNAYNRSIDKDLFINNLKESYLIRGFKGVQFSWIPIIK